jgi:hypothetical protein
VSWWWPWWAGALTLAGRIVKDWRDPGDDHMITFLLACACGIVLAVAALIILVAG